MKFLTILKHPRKGSEGFCIPVAKLLLRNVRKLAILRQRLDRQTRSIAVNPASIPLAINDIEQICAPAIVGYKGGKG